MRHREEPDTANDAPQQGFNSEGVSALSALEGFHDLLSQPDALFALAL